MFKKVILSLVLISLFWSLVTPIFEFPDEQAHIGTVEFLVKNGRIPVGQEYDMTKEMQTTQKLLGVFRDSFGNNQVTYHPEYRISYSDIFVGLHESEIIQLNNPTDRGDYIWKEAARYPRLYYDFVGITDKLVIQQDIILRIFSMRIFNLLIFAATIYISYCIGLLIFGQPSLSMVLAGMVALQPMFTFLSAGINPDNLHHLLFTYLIYQGIKIVKFGINKSNFSLLFLVFCLDIFTKPQGYIGITIVGIAILITMIKAKLWRQLLLLLLAFIPIAILVVSPLNPYSSWVTIANSKGVAFIPFLQFSVNKLISQNIVWYWGVFKWLGVVLPPIYWQLSNRVVLLSGFGLFVYYWRVLKKQPVIVAPKFVNLLLFSTLIYTIAIYWFDWQYHKSVGYSIGVQARYFFPTIVAQMSLMMIGLLSLTPNKYIQLWLMRGLLILFLWLQLGGIWRLITSYYDTSSIQLFITQASQYKPWFAKGNWWYLWGGLYLFSLISLFLIAWPRATTVVSKSKKSLLQIV